MTRLPRPSTGDLVAGVAVAAVLVPQSLAYARLAGMSPAQGVLAGTLPPIVAALLASSPYLQTGPVALTSLLTFGALTPHADPGSTRYVQLGIVLALVIGVTRVVLGLVRGGAVAYLMSEPVLLGFVQGAAVLICLSQIPTLVGVASGSGWIPLMAWDAVTHPSAWSAGAVVFGLAALGSLLFLRRLQPLFPWVLIAVALSVIVSRAIGFDGPTLGSIDLELPELSFSEVSPFPVSVLISGLVIALVGFAEPVAIARTFATRERQRWDADRELLGQGAANLVSAVVAALPVGGSFSRSALNHDAGAKTRWSGAITGLAVILALPAFALLTALPLSILAAVVIVSVVSLFRPRSLARIVRLSLPQAIVAWATFVATLAFSPNVSWAVVLGIALAIAVHLAREREVDIELLIVRDRMVFRPRGVLWFVSGRIVEDAFAQALADSPEVRRVEISLRGIGRVDLTGALTLRRMIRDAREASLEVELVDIPPRARRWTRTLLASDAEPL